MAKKLLPDCQAQSRRVSHEFLDQAKLDSCDELGSRITQTDALNRATRYEFDQRGRRTRRTLPLGQFETYVYDAAGNLTARTDFNGKTTTYTYDALNRVSTVNASSGGVVLGATSYAYDANGNLASVTQPNAVQHAYTYDPRNRLTNLAVSKSPTPLASYAYTLAPTGAWLNALNLCIQEFAPSILAISAARYNSYSSGTTWSAVRCMVESIRRGVSRTAGLVVRLYLSGAYPVERDW